MDRYDRRLRLPARSARPAVGDARLLGARSHHRLGSRGHHQHGSRRPSASLRPASRPILAGSGRLGARVHLERLRRRQPTRAVRAVARAGRILRRRLPGLAAGVQVLRHHAHRREVRFPRARPGRPGKRRTRSRRHVGTIRRERTGSLRRRHGADGHGRRPGQRLLLDHQPQRHGPAFPHASRQPRRRSVRAARTGLGAERAHGVPARDHRRPRHRHRRDLDRALRRRQLSGRRRDRGRIRGTRRDVRRDRACADGISDGRRRCRHRADAVPVPAVRARSHPVVHRQQRLSAAGIFRRMAVLLAQRASVGQRRAAERSTGMAGDPAGLDGPLPRRHDVLPDLRRAGIAPSRRRVVPAQSLGGGAGARVRLRSR